MHEARVIHCPCGYSTFSLIRTPLCRGVFQIASSDKGNYLYTKLKCRNIIIWVFQIPYMYNGKLLREKIFMTFEVLKLFTKVFSTKFGGVVSFGRDWYQQAICKSFLHKNLISTKSWKFSALKVSCYTIIEDLDSQGCSVLRSLLPCTWFCCVSVFSKRGMR